MSRQSGKKRREIFGKPGNTQNKIETTTLAQHEGNTIMVSEETTNSTQSEDESKTLDFDPATRHPLQHSWVLWYDPAPQKKPSASEWGDNIKPIMAVDTVLNSHYVY